MKLYKIFIVLMLVMLLSSCSGPVEYSEGKIVVSDSSPRFFVEFTMDTNNLTLLSIGVKENDDEISDNIEYIDLKYSKIEDDLVSVLSALEGEMVCTGECTIYGANSDIIITLTDGETIFDLKLANNGAMTFLRGASKTSGKNFEFSFADQYLLELTRIYEIVMEAYEK